ncbi:MAG: SPFH protein, partial [uncultured bacterium]
SAEAIRRITAAIGDKTGPMSYMLGEKYIAALERMGEKDNAKVVVLPADLQEAVKGLFGRRA